MHLENFCEFGKLCGSCGWILKPQQPGQRMITLWALPAPFVSIAKRPFCVLGHVLPESWDLAWFSTICGVGQAHFAKASPCSRQIPTLWLPSGRELPLICLFSVINHFSSECCSSLNTNSVYPWIWVSPKSPPCLVGQCLNHRGCCCHSTSVAGAQLGYMFCT